MVKTTIPKNNTDILTVEKTWSGVEVTDFGPYFEAIQARLLDCIWSNAEFKKEIFTDPKAVYTRESDISFSDGMDIKVFDDTDESFYFIVPEAPLEEEIRYRYEQFANWWSLAHAWWYMYAKEGGLEKARTFREGLQALWIVRTWSDDAFKEKLIGDPKTVLDEEMGIVLPSSLEVKCIAQPRNALYLVVPVNPADKKLDEHSLMGDWWRTAHTYWWFITSLRFSQPI